VLAVQDAHTYHAVPYMILGIARGILDYVCTQDSTGTEAARVIDKSAKETNAVATVVSVVINWSKRGQCGRV
jgi:hypothetical protein